VARAGFGRNARWGAEAVTSVLGLGADGVDRGDLKLVSHTLKELRRAFEVFEPHRGIPKAAVFGSARTRPGEPAYDAAVELGAALAAAGWMVITGGGPGIMTAAVEGAGPSHSFGVNITLPFEPANESALIPADHSVTFRYFFTRKVTFMKESAGFVLLPGGFGTLDEAFELLTLLQTGRSVPAPVVLFEPEGDAYWRSFRHFLDVELADAAMVSRDDLDTFTITSDVDEAVSTLAGFYRVYHSLRYVGDWLVVRMRSPISDDLLAGLDTEFADILESGHIERCGATDAERNDDDHVELPRIRLRFTRSRYARLHALVKALNREA
jgi:uncharacterized protein (TIGR00730 family)